MMGSGSGSDAGTVGQRKFVVSSYVLQDKKFLKIATTLVKPEVTNNNIRGHTPPITNIPLSNLDRVFGYYYTPLILYYPNLDQNPFSDIVERLKNSLSKVLVTFYPLAGRVRESGELSAEIYCNDAGAIFTEAAVDAHLEELRIQGGYSPAPILSGIAAANIGPGPLLFSPSGSGLPTLITQITRFLCGGFAVAINWLHRAADGFAGVQFVKVWADCSRLEQYHLSVDQPVFDRSILKPSSAVESKLDIISTEKAAHPTKIEAMQAEQGARTTPQLPSFWIQEFPSQALEKLKKEATKDGEGPFSTADCLSAHLWKCLTRARSLAPEETTNMVVAVEGRHRMIPPLSKAYFGNVLFTPMASATVRDLMNKPLSFGAGLIRKAIKSTTHESYQSLIDWVQLQSPTSKGIHPICSQAKFATTDMGFSSWASFDLYDIDFGWQKPEFAVRNAHSDTNRNGMWHLFPSQAGKDHRSVQINLQADTLAILLDDPEFCPL